MLSDTGSTTSRTLPLIPMAYAVEVDTREAMAMIAATLVQLKNMLSANSAAIARHEGMLNGNRLTLVENRDILAENVDMIHENNKLLQINNKLLVAVCSSLGLEV